jgi:uncharacterized HAD superfamily protein/adenine/guanine phosphoribosyltransferase-like PRPP-binding protein
VVAAMDDIVKYWKLSDGAEPCMIFRDDRINFRSLRQANQTIKDNLGRISGKYDLIVGIPRSGLLLASIIALQLNVRFASIAELSKTTLRRAYLSRSDSFYNRHEYDGRPTRILVVDDSINTGSAMNNSRRMICDSLDGENIIVDYCAIYCTEERKDVDIYFEVVKQPRLFEWNFLHHGFAKDILFDMDGVICVDGPAENTGDPEPYIEHLVNARPKFIPRMPVGAVVTSRLEKYRDLTTEWLRKNGVRYRQLVMLNVVSAEERRRLALHAKFKADVYTRLGGVMFIESEAWQAREIASITHKPVYDLSASEMLLM